MLIDSQPRPQSTATQRLVWSCSRLEEAGCVRLVPTGEVDIAAVPHLDAALSRAAADAALVVLDLRRLEFMDCNAAAAILLAHRRMRAAGRRLLVVRGSAEITWFLRQIGLDRLLELVDVPPRSTGASYGDAVVAAAPSLVAVHG